MPGLIRVILLAILCGVLFSLYRKFQKKFLDHKNSRSDDKAQSPARMLRCHHCGIYFPEGDAIKKGEHVYCSQEHGDQSNEH